MFPNWSNLPPELIEAISNRISAYIDYIRFRAVCISWRSAIPKFPNHNHLPTQVPWLMIPLTGDKTGNYQSFFSISDHKYHILQLPECRGKKICGSSQGWFLMLERGPAVSLFNPITRTLIYLPPLSTFPNVKYRPLKVDKEFKAYDDSEEQWYTYSLTMMQNYFIRKMVLNSSPCSNDYTVVVILSNYKLGFMKKGDEVWSLVNDPEFIIEDVIFYKGRCFGVDTDNRVVVCDFDSPPKVTLISPGPQEVGAGEVGFSTHYLVDFSGDLLLVSRTRESDDKADSDYYTTVKFRVFKPDQSGQEWRWRPIKDLGDHVLFLGPNSSVSVIAHEFSGCQRNCIYFADDNHDYYNYRDEDLYNSNEIGGHDLGVFDLNDENIKANPYHMYNPKFIWPPPIWVTPNPN